MKNVYKRLFLERIAVNGFPSHSYWALLAIWDHTVLPATVLPDTSERAPA